MSSTSITDQIRAAVELGGGQAAVVRAVRAAGGKLNSGALSLLCNGRTPALLTLRDIAKATGYRFEISGDTDLGESRPPRWNEGGA
jgi:hypothetical protein